MILDERGIEMKKNDWILGGGIVLAAGMIFLFQLLRDSGGAKEVTISADGDVFGTYSLEEDQTVEIGGTNRLVIEDGTARMEWADCPDQICVNHRPVSRNGESIICLPNEVVVSVKGGEEAELDGVVQ